LLLYYRLAGSRKQCYYAAIETNECEVVMLNAEQIMQIIPHRYPFLLIDRVIELEAGKSAVALKNVTNNEPHFQGHFPDFPLMPGVLIVEALAQTACVAMLSLPELKGKFGIFAGIENVRFRRQVVPGDTLRLEFTIEKIKRSIGKGHGIATVDGEVACEADLLFAMTDGPNAK
jgi:3-hydroxyacyl-[acyl-carrier-protein] dehydratase